ncbi:hypothetical protein [Campylobacter sp. RM16192]|uniref:hypothetical protein n=1 Tax=Campylobacter sp. RM16192 TaxID=1660080 RepID=UPI0014525843|nr:hypothetical protein [Campylobacter sp. RM16192]QCD53442.1 putative protein (DUF2846 domain) [Campylobacter sp. RM16192]
MCLKNKVFQVCLLITVVFSISGCGAKGAKFSVFEKPKENKALLYVYRPSAFTGGGVFYDVKATIPSSPTIVLGELRNGGYIKADLEANEEIEIWAKTESKSSVTIETKANETYCVKGEVGIGFFIGRPHLKQVDLEKCKKEIINTRSTE